MVLQDRAPVHFIECKTSGRAESPALRYLKLRFPGAQATQVSLDEDLDLVTRDGIRVCSLWAYQALIKERGNTLAYKRSA